MMVRPARSARVRAARIAFLLAFAMSPDRNGEAAWAAPARAATPQRYGVHVTEASQRFGVPEAWIWRVMHVESRGRPRAVSSAGAMGLMQIMPGTWSMLTARHRLGTDPFDIRANILAGAAYLRAMWDRYGDVPLMLAAYNAGPGRVDAYAAGRRALPAETVAYVAQIAPALGAPGVAPLRPVPRGEAPEWLAASLFMPRSDRRAAAAGETPPLQPERDANASTAPVSQPRPSLFAPLSGPRP